MNRALVAVVLVSACSSGKTGTKAPGEAPQPPPPPPGARFVCDRAPLDPRVTWRDCQLTADPLQDRAFCFTARAASGSGRLHSLCTPTEVDCRRWSEARQRERNDVVDACVSVRASQTGTIDGTPPPRDGRFRCETRPDPRRMIAWRECEVVDAAPQDTAHCFVTSWRGGQHSVCAPTDDECRTWAAARQAERKDVLAPCKLARPADYWPLPSRDFTSTESTTRPSP